MIDLISPTNTYEFNKERDTIKNSRQLHIAKVAGQPAEIVNKKCIVSRFQVLEKKRKREMAVVDFVIITRQQSFQKHDQLNPIEIKIEEHRIINFFKKIQNLHISI